MYFYYKKRDIYKVYDILYMVWIESIRNRMSKRTVYISQKTVWFTPLTVYLTPRPYTFRIATYTVYDAGLKLYGLGVKYPVIGVNHMAFCEIDTVLFEMHRI